MLTLKKPCRRAACAAWLLMLLFAGCTTVRPPAPGPDDMQQFLDELRALQYGPKHEVLALLARHGFGEPIEVTQDGDAERHRYYKSYLGEGRIQMYDQETRFFDRLTVTFADGALMELDLEYVR